MTETVQAQIRVRVVPRASKNQIDVSEEGLFKVRLTAPPVEGKANQALKKFLAQTFNVTQSDVQIVSGERSKEKLVHISGRSIEDLKRKLM